MMTLQIDDARPEEKELVIRLLKEADLLTEDLPDSLPNFLLAKEGEVLVGVAGLERFGSVGLLRSVAVSPAHQGQGIAGHMVERLLNNADKQKLEAVYLITTTADHYFDRYGFIAVDRQQVPEAIQQTRQFSGLCPSSAVVMKRNIKHQTA
ncbi:arsenic resistance N-acetyltransferase ArsN2 [Dyadobacter chenwenxiniae]|uniref:Arsenic resistance N-acetyltransferase ArsN2 n=1 Tax=Dyadobacter chenwenxiniae TaxID=2906456 RepID=A0A9X1TCT0_9BACT|nr:arsenic resistance N-acetyltransferase ArsN2 [Dyadobacter chenwenxiniae]MCF0060447.1 arsenic resistance N-acetyltransferase ArsN2 [Dyadobacter chenwenxiniae]UON86178.1 arsenic resistance N-acetyltransferase ArsN2 [Dyadobacter chenwenxiniae]